MSGVPPVASLGDSLRSFANAVGDFLGNLADVGFSDLLAGLVAFVVYLSLRAYAYTNVIRAAPSRSRPRSPPPSSR